MMSSAAAASRAGISHAGSRPLGPRMSRMSSSGAGGEAGAELGEDAGLDPDAGLNPDREPGREPEPEPEPEPELEPELDAEPDPASELGAGADSGGGSDAGAEERFGGVKNSGAAGTRVTGDEGDADSAAGEGRGTGAGSTGPTGVCAALASAALVSAKDWVPAISATRPSATTAHAWEERLLVRGLIRADVHGF